MGRPRRLAVKLLSAVLRHAPDDSRDWASAMLRELDFIEGDWAALLWAIGSATAILRRAASVWRLRFKNKTMEGRMINKGKKALGVGLGMLSALALVGCALATLRIAGLVFPGLDHSPWAYWLAVMAVPEAIFVAATVMLWRKKGPVAAGILAAALVVALHVAVHLTLHW
jgi:hypothetical protein